MFELGLPVPGYIDTTTNLQILLNTPSTPRINRSSLSLESELEIWSIQRNYNSNRAIHISESAWGLDFSFHLEMAIYCRYVSVIHDNKHWITILPLYCSCLNEWGRIQIPGSTPLYKLYRYLTPHRVGFLRRFCLKTGINFAHFGLEWGMVLGELRECMNVFIVSIPNE